MAVILDTQGSLTASHSFQSDRVANTNSIDYMEPGSDRFVYEHIRIDKLPVPNGRIAHRSCVVQLP